jgi:predicted anti-sigma-YlaC factor YlaD
MQAVERPHSPTPEEVMAHLDGEPTTLPRDAMDAHLAACATCRSIADDLRGVTRATKAWTVDAAPATLAAEYAERGEAAEFAEFAERKRMRLGVLRGLRGPAWMRSRAGIAAVGAAAAVVIVIAAIRETRLARTMPIALDSAASRAVPESVMPSTTPVPPPAPAVAAPRAPVAGNVGGTLAGRASAPRFVERARELAAGAADTQGQISRGPMVIRTAVLNIVVKEFDPARGAVEKLVADSEGFIDTLTLDASTATARSLQGTLRVPADRLADVLTRLRQLGQVVQDSQGSQDVTDQIVDLDARLASARATEQRLTELLQNRTGRLSDVLDVERELARVRLDIERLDAQKTNVTRRVAYASIDVHIAEERKAGLDTGPLSLGSRIRVAAADGIEAAIASVVGLLLLVLSAGPVLLLWGGAAAALWLILRRAKVSRPRASE